MRGKPTRSRRTRHAAGKAPAYERDDGPLTAKQIKAIKKLVPQGREMVVTSSLFPSLEKSRRPIKACGTAAARLVRKERNKK